MPLQIIKNADINTPSGAASIRIYTLCNSVSDLQTVCTFLKLLVLCVDYNIFRSPNLSLAFLLTHI